MRLKELKEKSRAIKEKKHITIKAVKFDTPIKVNRMVVLK